MKLLLLSLFFILDLTVYSQKHYPLHPSVGDTIDKLEKLDYSLFPQINNQGFKYSLIEFIDNGYSLVVIDTNGVNKTHPISKEELIEAQQNIEKVNQYYRLMEEEKKSNTQETNTLSRRKDYPIRIEGPMSEQMKKEARMNVRLREDARRRADFDKGINPNSFYIEFK